MLGLLCIATGRAQFAPEEGKMYALKETTSGLYLDIQTLGINEPNAGGTTNNISLNFKPCVIYFAAGTTDNKWTMKNVNRTYAMQATSRNWNAVVGTTAYEWLIAETGTDTDLYTIARSDGKFISMDTPTSGAPLYCDKGSGLKFQLVEYSALRQAAFTLKSPLSGVTKGAIQSAAQLNAITTATKIVIQSFSGTNNCFLGGAANVEDINDAVLVWEPVEEGKAGTYYLRTTDAKKGYIQASTGENATITLGTKENAQVFVTTAPTTSGDTDATTFSGEALVNGVDGQVVDADNFVRFVQDGKSTWLNVNNAGAAPRLGNSGKGGWTVHNVFLVTEAATYLSLTTVSTTAASMQATPTEFYIIPSADTYLLQNKANAAQYVGYTAGETWDVTTSVSCWKILDDDDNDGFAQIARGDDALKHLGSDNDSNVGTGIYTNVSSDCNAWCFTGVYKNYATTATNNGGKYEFTSGLIYTAGPCNKIRFTLTESGAYYSNGVKRLSFDSFVLYDAKGNVVPLTAGNITGNNGKVYNAMLDGTAGTYTAGTWDNASATDDWFEIDLGKVNLEGAFKFSFVTENTQMNAKAFEIKMSYEKPADYIFVVNAPDGKDYSVTYNGEPIAAGDQIGIVSFDEELLVATEIAGYTWSVVVDDDNNTITLVYTEAEVVENPAAVVALLNRIGGDGTDAKFKIVLDPSMNSRQEVFVINGEDGKVLIKGTTLSAITTGIGWYLQNIAHINISWNSLNEKTVSGAAYADLSSIPVPTAEETHTSDAMYRYYLNTCAFGYSMTSWTWKRWQQEIDWMALHGINMPLQLVGMEEVWRKFLTMEDDKGNRKYGYTDEEAKAFVAGPAFIAWWAMNNLQGWGGTAAGTKSGGTWEGAGGVQDDAWYARQQQLATQILTRQRELGMQPVIPGWSGMVPSNFKYESGYETRGNGVNWAGDFVRPLLLSVNNANYAEIAADYYACLHEVMGESRYYSMDPFHEGGGAGTMEDYEALYAAMETANPGSQWVIQQWQWSATQKYALTAVPAGRLVVLDLFSDGSPAFDSYSGYAPQDAVFCAIPNFGGRSGLMGRLTNLTNNYFLYKGKYSSIKGIGVAPEAIEQTPVTYDLIFQLPWMNGVKPDVAEWVSNYSIARYGVVNEEIQEAWSLLRQGPLNYGADGIQGPIEDVWAARPNLEAYKASAWGKTLANAQGTYTKARQQMLIDATYKLLDQSGAVAQGTIYESNLNYDLVEFGGGVLADYAYYLLLGIKEAKNASNTALYEARRDAFLQLILDVDRFKGTNLNFRLGKWTQEARAAAAEVYGATTATADWYEYNNARTIVSTWSHPSTNLTDYSYRSWQGLMKDLYYPRWVYFFENDCTPVRNVDEFPATPYGYFEWNWAHGKEHSVGQTAVSNVALTEGQAGHTSSYTREPEGNTVEVATEVLGKYIIPLKTDNGTTYAYRYLTNTLSAEYKVEGAEGGTIDLSKFFLANIDGATVTGDFIDGAANDIKAVPVKSGIAGNTYDAVMTLTDGTVVNFKVVVNSAEMVTAKEELAALIEDMEELTALVGTFNPVGTVTEVGDLTAEGTAGTTEFYVWTNAQEDSEGPIANLVDGSVDTHFHSEYSSNVGANHFINIDLGDNNKMSSFRFIYSTRKAQTDFPKTIEVSGCNERDGTYEYITTVTNLPAGNSNSVVTYVSDRISCVKEYAYLRFTVTANNSGNNEAGGHPYFHMSEFGLEVVCATADVIDVYDGTELTDAFAAKKYDVLLAAINVYKTATTPEQIAAATTALQAAYDELQELVDVLQPEEPVGFNGVYQILYKQNPVFIAYLEGNELIAGANAGAYRLFDSNTDGIDENQRGYHNDAMEGKVEADALFTIVPNGEATGYTLSAQGMHLKDTYAGWWGASAFSTDKNQAGVYIFEETTVDDLTEYRLKSTTSTWLEYVNDWGIVFGNNDSNNTFATFTLSQVTEYTLTVPKGGVTTLWLPFNVVLPEGVTAYDVNSFETQNGLCKYTLTELAVAGKTLAKNTPVVIEAEPGNYTLKITMNNEGAIGSANGSALCGNYWERNLAAGENNYQPAVTADGLVFNRVDAPITVAANTAWLKLTEDKGAVIYKEFPEGTDAPTALTDGAVYRIKGRLSNGNFRTVYTNGAGNRLRWTSEEKSDITTLFVVQETTNGKFKLVSALGNGLWNNERVLDENGVELSLLPGSVDGTCAIRGNGERNFAADGGGDSGEMNFFSGSNSNVQVSETTTTDFVFEEVSADKVAFNKIIRKGNHYATLFLPYNVTVPENVKAYTATIENKDQQQQGVISLVEIADGIIPERTAVILRREDNTAIGEFSFKYTTDASSYDYEDNLFGGRVTTGYVGSEPGQDNDKYYLLLNTETKGEALYKVYREYNSWGEYVGENGGYIKCEGNKGYMKLSGAQGASSSYSFRIEGSTGIEDVEGENGYVKAVYDLQGRKLTEITEPGIYIINGKKVLVK